MRQTSALFTGAVATIIRRAVTVVVFVIAGLAFAFGFGNGWQLGLSLGVPGWIAPLVAPAVDLSVIVLLGTVQYLRSQGVGGRLAGPRLLLGFCGLMTFGLNTVRAITTGQTGRACFDAIAPLLLIGWSEVGPRLLALLHQPVPERQANAPDETSPSQDRPTPSPRLVHDAARLDREYQEITGRRIPRDKLRAALKVSNATAGELLRLIREAPADPIRQGAISQR